MTSTTERTHRAWDDPSLRADVVHELLATPRRPLYELDLTALNVPGAYVMHVATTTPAFVEVFSETLAYGCYPLYAGSSRRLGARLRRYEQSLRDLRDLSYTDLWVSVLPTTSHASALFAEASLLEGLQPIANKLGGFGAKVPGSNRARQKATQFDALLPGRSWVRPPSLVDRIRARAAVVAYLAGLDPAGPRWEPLIR